AKGLADYRSGRYPEAIRRMDQFPPDANGIHHDAIKFAVLAMAHHRLGHADDAEAARARAKAILAKMPDPARGQPFDRVSWYDWLQARVLCREAEDLMKKESDRK